MPELDDALLTPPQRQTRAQERAIDAARIDRAPGLFQGASDAVRTAGTIAWGLHYLDTSSAAPDENWNPTKEDMERLTADIPLSQFDQFDDASSLSHAEAIRAKLLNINERRGRLADMGWKGTALTIGAGILDPVAIGSAFITGGASYASMGSRVARIAAFAGENAAINAGFAGLQLAQDPDMQLNDFVFAVGTGAALGAGVSEFSRALARWGTKTAKEADVAAIRRVPTHGMGSMNAAGLDRGDSLNDALRTVRSGDEVVDAAGSPAPPAAAAGEPKFLGMDDDGFATYDAPGAGGGSPPPNTLEGRLSTKGAAFYRDQIAKAPLEQRQALLDNFMAETGLDPTIHVVETKALRQLLGDPDVEIRLGDEEPGFDTPAPDDLTDVFNFAAGDGGGGGAGGAGTPGADVPKPNPPKIGGDFWARPVDAENWNPAGNVPYARALGRWGMSTTLSREPSRLVRGFSNSTFADALYKKGGGASPYSWHEWAKARSANFIDEFEAKGREHVAKYKELSGKDEGEFWREVGTRMQMGFDPAKPVDSPTWKMANELSRLTTDVLDLARRHGLKWAVETPDDPSYLSRFWLDNKLTATIGRLGEGGEDLLINDLFAPALRNARPDLTIEKARKLARVYVRAIQDIHNYTDVDRARMFSVAGDDVLRDAIKRHQPNMSAEDVEAILYTARPRKGEGGGPGQLRKRVDIDINHSARFVAADGTDLGEVHVRDFLQTDARAIFHKYAHDMVGAAGDAETLTKMSLFASPDGKIKFEDFNQLKNAMVRELESSGRTADQIQDALDVVDFARAYGRGMPMATKYKRFNEFLEQMRLVNYIRLGGTFVLAQLSELGKLYGEFGVQAMKGAIPSMRQTLKRAADGKLDYPQLREMQAMYTPGYGRVINQTLQRIDEDATLTALSSDNRVTKALRRGARLTSDVSLLSWTTIDAQRKAAAAAGNTLADAAHQAMGRPQLSARRLASLGMTQEQWEKAADAIRRHSYRDGEKGPWLIKWSEMKGKDAEWASMSIGAIDRWSRRVALDPDVSEMSLWMTKPGAKSLLQFRGFSLQTWSKGILHGMQMRDARTAVAFFGSAFSAAMIYTAQTYLDSLGQKDADKFRREKLTARNIGAAAWSRGAYSSVLPMAFDTASYVMGDRTPLFNNRYSGLGSAVGLDSNATSQLLLKTAPAAVKAGAQLVRRQFGYPDRGTQTDRRNAGLMLPWARQYPIKLILDYWASHGAKSEPRSAR